MKFNKKLLSLKRGKFYIRQTKRKVLILYCNYMLEPLLRKMYKLKYKSVADPHKVIVIVPSSIVGWCGGSIYKNLSFIGQIRSGGWDKNFTTRADKMIKSVKIKGINERFIEGKEWGDTTLFDSYRRKINRGVLVKGMGSIEELEEYYNSEVDSMYNSIKKNGIIASSSDNSIAPIYVNIGRDGRILYTNEGNHRFAMTLILGIEKIPVKVWTRHKKWQEIRDKILGREFSSIPAELKKFIIHPDIIDEISNDVLTKHKKEYESFLIKNQDVVHA